MVCSAWGRARDVSKCWLSHHQAPPSKATPNRWTDPFKANRKARTRVRSPRPFRSLSGALGKKLRRPVGGALSAVSFPGARERPLEPTSQEVECPRHVKNETHTGCQHRTLGLSWPGLDALSTPIRSVTSAGMPDDRTSSSANSDAEKGQRCIAGQRV